MSIQELFGQSEILRILGFVLMVGVGWLVLRVVFKIAGRIFKLGCWAILLIGAVILVMRVIG